MRIIGLLLICFLCSCHHRDHKKPPPKEEAEDSVDQDELILDEDVDEELPKYPASGSN